MRIVAGKWRGRRLEAPAGRETRPTSDRVREGLFSGLASLMGPDLGGARVLDLFAGTGALSLEALSRGASHAVAVESDAAAIRALRANAEALGAADALEVVVGDALGAGLARAAARGPFALMMCDAPYRIEPASLVAALSRLEEAGGLTEHAISVFEHASGAAMEAPDGHAVVKTYVYGSTTVTVMERTRGA